MKLNELFNKHAGKHIKVEMSDGEIVSGILSCYISAEDNDPEPECIVVNNVELSADEIMDVKIEG